MDFVKLQQFFLWFWIVNFAFYFVTVLATMVMRNFIVRVNQKMFGVEEQFVRQSIHKYIANFKLIAMVFSFAPWLALVILNS